MIYAVARTGVGPGVVALIVGSSTAMVEGFATAASSTAAVSFLAAAVVSVESGSGGAASELFGARLPLGTRRLVLRNMLPNLVGVFFSPSAASVSEGVSDFFSLLVPRVPKKEVRRLSLAPSGVVAVGLLTTAEDSGFSVAGSATAETEVASGEAVVTGSSSWGAVAETGVVSASLAGVKGATSFVPGAAESFLPKKPKIEFLLAGFGAFSRVGVVATGSKALGSAVSSGTIELGASAVTVVVSSMGTTGEAMTRDAEKTR